MLITGLLFVAIVLVSLLAGALERRARTRRLQAMHVGLDATIDALARRTASEIVDDVDPADSGLERDDVPGLIADALENLWRQRDEDHVIERNRLLRGLKDRARWQAPVERRLSELLAGIPDRRRVDLPVLEWRSLSGVWRPDDIVDGIGMAESGDGGWLAFASDHRLVSVHPDRPRSVIAPPPPGFDANHLGELARDDARGLIAYWQRAWARRPSQTFMLDLVRGEWRVHDHAYRVEDEYATVRLVYAPERRALVRIGITYTSTFDGDRWVERPAGVLQIATSARFRLALTDRAVTILDMDRRRVLRASGRGWRVVARLAVAPGQACDPFGAWLSLERHQACVRHERRAQQLVIASSPACALDLRPAT